MSTTTFQFPLRDNGVPFSADTAVLQNTENATTSTYGIRVVGSGQIIAAAGTALVETVPGLYTYTFTDPAPNLTYEAWAYVTFTDPDNGNPGTLLAQKFATSAAAPSATGTISLLSSRQTARQFTRNAQDSTMYNNVAIDMAIQLAADEWLRITKSTRTLTTIQLSAGSNIVPAMPANWKPEYLFNFSLSLAGQNICPILNFEDPVSLAQANALVYGNNTNVTINSMQQPSIIAFTENAVDAGLTGPGVCDQAYTLGCWWWQPFTTWIPGTMGQWASSSSYTTGDIVAVATVSGDLYQSIINNNTANAPASSPSAWTLFATATTTATPNALFFNVTDDATRVILSYGVRAFLQMAEPENAKVSQAAMEQFQQKARQFKGRGSGMRGGNIAVTHQPPPPAYQTWAVPPPVLHP